MNWFPLCNYTHYSLLKGFSKPRELAKKCAENQYRACGIADYKSISGAVSFYKECIENNIKPIIGCSFDGFSLFAKNKNGWFDLIEIVSSLDTNNELNVHTLSSSCKRNNLICIAKNELESPIKGEDFYQKSNSFMDIYYTNKEDAPLHRILLCSAMKTTLPKLNTKIKSGKTSSNQIFFESNDFYLKNQTQLVEVLLSDADAVEKIEQIYNKCEKYNILNSPMLPSFPTPNKQSEEEYLKQLCRDGWRDLLLEMRKVDDPEQKDIYLNRFVKEFDVIKSADLFGYFLIVQDIVSYVTKMGWLSGPGRGSAAGCLISYLIGITQIDPIEFDLLFERFYNSGRNTEDNISLPDIDMDVPGNKRDEIIGYLKDKYGYRNVSQMLTFGRLQGRSALKEVLRVNGACGFSEMNEITKAIPNEAEISDQLQEMDEEDRSIIRWALENNADDLRDYCFINNNDELDGDYAEFFDQAIKIEGTFKTQGKHAAGVVISSEELNKVCPMVNPKSGEEKIAGLEMADLEALGHVKFDVLGINLLDKIMKIKELLQD
jgi:DNA polymerase-3 subunit alpha